MQRGTLKMSCLRSRNQSATIRKMEGDYLHDRQVCAIYWSSIFLINLKLSLVFIRIFILFNLLLLGRSILFLCMEMHIKNTKYSFKGNETEISVLNYI